MACLNLVVINAMPRTVTIFLFFLFSSNLISAQRVISGRALDVLDSMPLPQVIVLLKGTTQTTATNLEGKYSIQVPYDSGTLIFKFLGYITQEVSYGSQNIVDVILTPENPNNTDGYLLCYSPYRLQLGVSSGLNHTPIGLSINLRIPYLFGTSPRIVVDASYQLNGDATNKRALLEVTRESNFRVFQKSFDTHFEFKDRIIKLGETSQNLQEFGVLNSIKLRQHKIGLGLGLQTEKLIDASEQKFMALIVQYEFPLFNELNLSTQFENWKNNKQLKWEISHYVYKLKTSISINGEHQGAYNEYGFNLSRTLFTF
jgi:hypothetical protein